MDCCSSSWWVEWPYEMHGSAEIFFKRVSIEAWEEQTFKRRTKECKDWSK